MNPLGRLLRKNLSIAQMAGFVISNLAGLSIIMSALQIYTDVKPILSGEDTFVKKGYMVINKKVTSRQTFAGGSTQFTPADIDTLKAQSWLRGVGEFTAADFRVTASIKSPGQDRGLSTFLFFESVPAEYIDINRGDWTYTPGDKTIPIIMSKDYLALYNFGFANSAGLPQISEQLISAVPLEIRITSTDDVTRSNTMHGRIVGFSNRINTILVPQEFMEWANRNYGTTQKPYPSRLILDLKSPGDPQIKEYLDQRNWETSGSHDADRANYLLNIATGIVLFIGAVITVLSFFILFLSLSLLMQKNRDKLHSLLMLGYPQKEVAQPYINIIIRVSAVAYLLTSLMVLLLRGTYHTPLSAMGGGGSVWLAMFTGLTIAALTILCNIIAVRQRVKDAFRLK